MQTIGIIIPVYNAGKYIERCLKSVLQQSFQDFQIILVNDGSKDSSLEVCRKYSQADSRIVVLDKPNGGAASARNLGLDWFYANSESQWLCFLDIDDFIHQRYLEILLNAAEETHAEVSMCAYEITHNDDVECNTDTFEAKLLETEKIWCDHQSYCTIPPVKLFSRKAFSSIRFPEGIIHEDEFTLYKVLFQYRSVAFVDLPLYGYYQTEQSVMRGKWTPRHMTEPQGLLSQLRFFEENAYDRAAAYTAKMYLFSLYRNMVRSQENEREYKTYTTKLKRELQKGLIKYGKLAGVSLKTENWLYYAAFPIGTMPVRAWKKCFKEAKSKGE